MPRTICGQTCGHTGRRNSTRATLFCGSLSPGQASFSPRSGPSWEQSWDFPLILPICFSKSVNEIPLLEDEHRVSQREQQEDQDVYAHIVDEESNGNDCDARAQVPRMAYHSIDSVLEQLALLLLGR